ALDRRPTAPRPLRGKGPVAQHRFDRIRKIGELYDPEFVGAEAEPAYPDRCGHRRYAGGQIRDGFQFGTGARRHGIEGNVRGGQQIAELGAGNRPTKNDIWWDLPVLERRTVRAR